MLNCKVKLSALPAFIALTYVTSIGSPMQEAWTSEDESQINLVGAKEITSTIHSVNTVEVCEYMPLYDDCAVV